MFEQTTFPSEIIVHHSATLDDPVKLDTDNFRRDHVRRRGFDDIGYHGIIELVDNGYEAIKGRPAYMHGAHCIGLNHRSLGICFVGDFNNQAPSDEMLRCAVREFILEWCWAFHIHPAAINPHHKYKRTDCPGRLFDVQRLRDLTKQAFGV